MGWKDAKWAYALDLARTQKSVLAAIAQATDDRTHQTYVSQKTIAGMLGLSVATVNRTVGALETEGVISRQRRNGAGGYRTTDLVTLNLTYITRTHIGDTHMGGSALLHDAHDPPTSPPVIAEEINQIDQPEDQPDNSVVLPGLEQPTFDDFYALWPKKKSRPDANKAWDAAVKRAQPEAIVEAARAYAANPHRRPMQFVPYPATWLRADGWADDLDGPPEAQRTTMTRTEKNLEYVQQLAAQHAAQARGITA